MFVREHYRSAQSSYCQAVHARPVTFDFDAFLSRKPVLLSNFLESWTTAFGTEAIRARAYPPESGDVRLDFAELARLPKLEPSEQTLSNPSIGGPLLEFKLTLNRMELPEAELRSFYRSFATLASENPRYRQPAVASPEGRERYLMAVAEDREQLKATFGIALHPVEGPAVHDFAAEGFAGEAGQIAERWSVVAPASFANLQRLVQAAANPQPPSWTSEMQAILEAVG